MWLWVIGDDLWSCTFSLLLGPTNFKKHLKQLVWVGPETHTASILFHYSFIYYLIKIVHLSKTWENNSNED